MRKFIEKIKKRIIIYITGRKKENYFYYLFLSYFYTNDTLCIYTEKIKYVYIYICKMKFVKIYLYIYTSVYIYNLQH